MDFSETAHDDLNKLDVIPSSADAEDHSVVVNGRVCVGLCFLLHHMS